MSFRRLKNFYVIILITKNNLKNKMTAFYARDRKGWTPREFYKFKDCGLYFLIHSF